MKTGELARCAGVKTETVLFYEKAGLLPKPLRTGSNYREYNHSHLARLSFIRRARELGFDLASIQKLLSLADDQAQPCESVDKIASMQLRDVELRIASLVALQTELSSIVGQCKHGQISNCRIIEALSIS